MPTAGGTFSIGAIDTTSQQQQASAAADRGGALSPESCGRDLAEIGSGESAHPIRDDWQSAAALAIGRFAEMPLAGLAAVAAKLNDNQSACQVCPSVGRNYRARRC